MYAIIESCGKQYKVAEGEVVFFEKLDAEEGKKVTFDKVILVSEEGKVQVGAPYVKGVKVTGSMPNNGSTSATIDGLTSTSVTIPAGYTSGGTVSLTSDIEDALSAI